MTVKYKDKPSSSNTSRMIWRYMSLTKLLSIIHTESLFFPNLKIFEDVFEGFYRNLDWLAHVKQKKDVNEFVIYDRSNTINRNFASCWFKADYESLAMWSIYGQSNDSIAIQSDLNCFRKCINDNRDWNIEVGKIKYVYWTSETNFSIFHKKPIDDELFWYKDKSFEYENEWRLKISFTDEEFSKLDNSKEYGLNIKVDVNKLIERIYVSPNCNNWRYETIKTLLNDLGVQKEVRKSRINKL